jgi:hypothetical protein
MHSTPAILAMLLATYAAFHLTRDVKHFAAHYDSNDLVVFYEWGVDHNLGGNVWTAPPVGAIRPGLGWHFCNYTPFFVLAFAPLARLSLARSYAIWQSIQLFNLVLALFLLARVVRPRLSFTWTVVFLALALLSEPVAEMLKWAQASAMLLLALTIALIGTQTRRAPLAGFGLAIATLIKLFPGIVIGFFALRRRWSEFIWTALFFALGAGLTGLNNWIDFATKGLFQSRIAPYNHLESSILATVQYWAFQGDVTHARWPVILVVTALIDVGVISVCVWATRNAADDESIATAFGLWLAAGVLLSPVAWIHDIVLAAPLALFATEMWYQQWSRGVESSRIVFLCGTALLLGAFILGAYRPLVIAGFWIAALLFGGATLILKVKFDDPQAAAHHRIGTRLVAPHLAPEPPRLPA